MCDTVSVNVWEGVQVSVGWCECLMERVCDCVNVCVLEGARGDKGVPSSLGIAFWKVGHTL